MGAIYKCVLAGYRTVAATLIRVLSDHKFADSSLTIMRLYVL